MKKGKALEEKVKNDTEAQRIYCLRIPEGVRHIGRKLIPHKTKYDFLALTKTGAIAFDCKECDKDKFYFKSYVFDEKKIHQFNALCEAQAYGIRAGYLVHFTSSSEIAWLSVDVIEFLVAKGEKGAAPKDLPTIKDTDTIDFSKFF